VKSVPRSYTKQLGGIAKKLLEDGTPKELVVAAAVVAAEEDRPPSALPGLIVKVQTKAAGRPRARRYGRGMTTAEMLEHVQEAIDEQG
jgi:hypothetical protein